MDSPGQCPARWFPDHNFGIPPHDFFYPYYDMPSSYYRPWKWYSQSISKEAGSTVENEKGNYKITLDVQHYRAEEINVKVSDNEIIVEGKHEERPDTHGFIMRQFKRRYPLPSNCPSDNVTSTLSTDGILTIIAEKKTSKDIEKIVPIKICGTIPRKTQIETKISSEIFQTSQKENNHVDDIMNKTRSQITLKEDHSRLLKPELLKDINTETNGSCPMKAPMKETAQVAKTTEKTGSLDIDSTRSKIEESIGKSILGLTALTEQLGQSSLASTSEANTKSASENITKGTTEIRDDKGLTEMCGIKNMSDICEMKVTSDSGLKAMSKTLIEESSSSYKSCSSSMSSSTRVSGKTGEFSDIITAELREAAENV